MDDIRIKCNVEYMEWLVKYLNSCENRQFVDDTAIYYEKNEVDKKNLSLVYEFAHSLYSFFRKNYINNVIHNDLNEIIGQRMILEYNGNIIQFDLIDLYIKAVNVCLIQDKDNKSYISYELYINDTITNEALMIYNQCKDLQDLAIEILNKNKGVIHLNMLNRALMDIKYKDGTFFI